MAAAAMTTARAVPRPACLPADRPWPPRAQRTSTPTQQPVRPATTGAVCVTGTLLEDAVLRHPPGGQGSSTLVLKLTTGHGLTVLARQQVGSDPSAIRAAHTKARTLLRRGQLATIGASGLRMGHTEADEPAAVLVDVRFVTPHDIPAARAAHE